MKVEFFKRFLPEASVVLGTSWGSAVDWDCLPTSLHHPVIETEKVHVGSPSQLSSRIAMLMFLAVP